MQPLTDAHCDVVDLRTCVQMHRVGRFELYLIALFSGHRHDWHGGRTRLWKGCCARAAAHLHFRHRIHVGTDRLGTHIHACHARLICLIPAGCWHVLHGHPVHSGHVHAPHVHAGHVSRLHSLHVAHAHVYHRALGSWVHGRNRG